MPQIRLVPGGVVEVRQGPIRGVGPQGVMGPRGLDGPSGPIGPQGPPGTAADRVTVTRRPLSPATVTISPTPGALYPDRRTVPLTEKLRNDILSGDVTSGSLKAIVDGTFVWLASVEVANPNDVNVRYEVSIWNTTTGTMLNVSTSLLLPGESATISVNWLGRVELYETYEVKVASSFVGKPFTIGACQLLICQTGVGPAGDSGPVGPPGVQGPTGIQGPAGNAGTGYATFAGLDSGNASTTDTSVGIVTSADQRLPLPGSTSPVRVPAWFKKLALALEPLLVSRYASVADRATKRTGVAMGEVYYLADSGSLKLGTYDNESRDIAQVIVSADVAPATGNYAPGTIWVQV